MHLIKLRALQPLLKFDVGYQGSSPGGVLSGFMVFLIFVEVNPTSEMGSKMNTEMLPSRLRLGLGFSKLSRIMYSFEALQAFPSHGIGPYKASQFHRCFFLSKRIN